MSFFPSPARRRGGAFTLAELMIAAGILVVGGGIAYPLLVGDLGLYVRNVSLNKSNNSLRYSLERLKKDVDMSIEPPLLMTYRVSGSTGVLKPADITNALGQVTTAAVSAPAVLMWVNLGPAYDLVPTGGTGTGGTVNPAGALTLKRHIATGTDTAATSPLPQVGDRLVVMSPTPYSTGMPEVVTMDGRAIQKPGRRITSVNGITANPVTDNGSATITVQLDLSNTTLPPSTSNPVYGDKSVYIVREVAYVANLINDGAGNPASCQLIYYPTTQNMTQPLLLSPDLDPVPQEQIPASWVSATGTGTVAVQTFNYYITLANTKGGRANLSPLNVNLPVRAIDYAHAIADRNVVAGQTNVSSEFNVFLRSSSQVAVKARLD